MTRLDNLLQRWRIAKARPFITPGSAILDIGSGDGVLFRQLGDTLGPSIGIDPTLKADRMFGEHRLVAGFFPKDIPVTRTFDVITMLAVLEHFPSAEYPNLRRGCLDFLKPGGLVVITVPSPAVDHILALLKGLRLIDGMSLEEHHGYDVRETAAIFGEPDFRLVRHRKFQLGLNNLFIFKRKVRTA